MEKWAKVLVDYSCKIQKGDWVYLSTNAVEAKPLYDAVRKEILRKGAHISDHFCYDTCGSRIGVQYDHLFLEEASEEQLDQYPEFKMAEIKIMQAIIHIEGSINSPELKRLPFWKYSRRMKTLEPIFDEKNKKAGVLTNYPTKDLARISGISLSKLRGLVYSALFLEKNNPVAEWQRISQNQAKLIEFLKDVELVRIKGTQSDLTLSVSKRIWANSDGHDNMPDGEVYTGPVEDSAEGVIYFGDFSVIDGGNEISGVRLKFQSGKIAEASAKIGSEYLQAILSADEGASRLGELGIGTNFGIKKPTKEILFDEKIGGTIHLALGDGYAETGSQNKSAIHQDIIKPLAIFDSKDSDQAELLVSRENKWFRMIRNKGSLIFEEV